MAATAIPGTVHVSTDSGATWRETSLQSPGSNIWISVDMTPDGSRMVAVSLQGGMFLSNDTGGTWTRIDTVANPLEERDYESVTISEDGQRIVAVDLAGNIYTSVNGAEATAVNISGAAFRAVDSSATGSLVVAADQNGALYRSVDGGAFQPLPVTIAGETSPVADSWYRVAVSPDGSTIVAAGNTVYPGGLVSTGIYISRDGGTTWVRGGNTGAAAYTSVDTSVDGGIIVATISNVQAAAGQVLLSTNGGTSFAPITTPAGETNWRAAALTNSADRLVLAAGTFGGTVTGLVYRSSGSVTGQ